MGHTIYQEETASGVSDYFDPWGLAIHDSICVVVGSNPEISSYRYRGSSESMVRLDAVYDTVSLWCITYSNNLFYTSVSYINAYSVNNIDGEINRVAFYDHRPDSIYVGRFVVLGNYVVADAGDYALDKDCLVVYKLLGDGNCEIPSIPLDLCLKACPNPFNGRLEINTELSKNIDIYNINGRLCASKSLNTITQLSQNRYSWNPENESSGVYLIRASNGETTEVIKVAYIK
jgi:hypothetical protein